MKQWLAKHWLHVVVAAWMVFATGMLFATYREASTNYAWWQISDVTTRLNRVSGTLKSLEAEVVALREEIVGTRVAE